MRTLCHLSHENHEPRAKNSDSPFWCDRSNVDRLAFFQLEEEIAKQEAAIRALEEAIRAKNPPQKLAETRLENRTYRPNVELCRDSPQYGLTDEVQQLKTTKLALQEKLKQAK